MQVPNQQTGEPKDLEDDSHSIMQISESMFPTIEEGKTETDPGQFVVPRSECRGPFAQFTWVLEANNPKAYPRRIKWCITYIVAIAAAAAPMGSTIFFPSLSRVSTEMHATSTVTNLSISLYMLSMSIFPLWWSSFSEKFGRRTVYLASFTLFVAFNILCSFSNSITMLIVTRMLSGGASASVQAVGAGTIADIWDSHERGRAITIFYLGPLCGPLIAPIVGGALAQKWGWRSTFWFLAAFGGLTVGLIFFVLPETLVKQDATISTDGHEQYFAEITSSRASSSQVLRLAAKWLKALKVIFIDPLKILLYLRYPPVLLTVYYASIAFGSLYVLNVSIEHTFKHFPYEFSALATGFLYIPNSLGYVVVSTFGGRWMDLIMQREALRANRYDNDGKLIYLPEDRMQENAWLGAFLYPFGLLCYGWTIDKGVFWFIPLLGNFFFGMGSMLIFSMATTMLTEFMPKNASAGVALNNFMRNIFSCIGSLVAAPMINAIGNGWLFTIMGVIGIASSSTLILMRIYGPRWRKSMDALAH